MVKRVWFGAVGLFVVASISVSLFGCAQLQTATHTGTPPSGTTQVKLGASNISVSATTTSLSLTALDQNNSAISGIDFGNLSAAIYTSEASANAGANAVVTVTFTAMSGGSSGSAKNVDAALVLDKSGSMGFDDSTYTKVTSAEIAGRLFISAEASASASNKAAVVLFDTNISVEAPMMALTSSGVGVVNTAINRRTGYGSSTALFDAIKKGIQQATTEAASSSLSRAVIVLTDGGENQSASHSTIEVVNAANSVNIPVYTVGLFLSTSEATGYEGYSGGTRRGDLQYIASKTTGSADNYFEIIVGASGLTDLTQLYQKLAGALTQSYTATATLSSALTSGTTYYLKLTLQNYGGFSGQSIIVAFTV